MMIMMMNSRLILLLAVVVYDLPTELSHYASLSTQHVRLSGFWLHRNSLPDEFRNSDSFDSFKRFMKTILFSHY